MSNGIASGVPPADGGAGGVAGAGVCARADELKAAMAQAASVIDTIERIVSSRVMFVFRFVDTPRYIGGINPSLP
jgi:biotin carboxylase